MTELEAFALISNALTSAVIIGGMVGLALALFTGRK